MGSRTVASAFTTQLQLRSFNIIGLGMIIIWSLSPIGGQSILHILYTPLQAIPSVSSVAYVNSRQQSYSSSSPQAEFPGEWFNSLQIEMASMLIAPTEVKESTMDLWRNVKIPFHSSVVASGIPPDSEGWVKVSSLNATGNGALIWSSLFGIPVTGLNFGNTTFNIESTHMELTCTNKTFESFEGPDGPDGPRINATYVSASGPYVSAMDPEPFMPWIIGYQGVDVTKYNNTDDNGTPYIHPENCPDCLAPDFANKTIQAGSLAFQAFYGADPGNATTVFCTPLQVYVESEVFCMKTESTQQCQVTAQRSSILPHMPQELTYLNFPQVALGLSALLPNITPSTDAINEIQNYIVYDPLDAVSIINKYNSVLEGSGSPQTFLIDVDLSDIGNRLGQILNAFVYGSTWNSTPYIIGETFEGMNGHINGGNNASFVSATRADLAAMIQNQTAAFTVPAVLTNQAQIYLCLFPWLGIFFFSTFVMLLAAITGVVFSRKTIVPDYLGFVSSLAKESPWIRMPDVGVNMDGMDKARLVKEVKVRLGDVSYAQGGQNDIGRLAFARLEETRKVKKGKLYV
jgi:hypothetical protein